ELAVVVAPPAREALIGLDRARVLRPGHDLRARPQTRHRSGNVPLHRRAVAELAVAIPARACKGAQRCLADTDMASTVRRNFGHDAARRVDHGGMAVDVAAISELPVRVVPPTPHPLVAGSRAGVGVPGRNLNDGGVVKRLPGQTERRSGEEPDQYHAI